jgi:hypothetical protein
MNPVDQLCEEIKEETKQKKDIREILNRRSDLSTFVVHLTKDKDSLESIINSWKIEARSVWGLAKNKVKAGTPDEESQKSVCLTEIPLEYIYLMIEPIKDRQFQPGRYGIAITKKLARKKGCNPVWYVDMTPGQVKQWELSNAVDGLVHGEIDKNMFDGSDVAKIAPFIEQMYPGTVNDHPKEFWWEREWRHVKDFDLPNHIIILCPAEEIAYFEKIANANRHSARAIDPNWGLEKIIARLGGFKDGDIDIL